IPRLHTTGSPEASPSANLVGHDARFEATGLMKKNVAVARGSHSATARGGTVFTSAQSAVAPRRAISRGSGVKKRARRAPAPAASRANDTIASAMYQVPTDPT